MLTSLHGMIIKVSGGSVTYPPKGRLGPRIQYNIQLVMIHSGHAYIEIDEQSYLVPAGSVALLCPGHRETFTFSETTETKHSYIHLEFTNLPAEVISYLEELPKHVPMSNHMAQLTEMICEFFAQSEFRTSESLSISLAISILLLYQSECVYRQQHLQKHEAILRAIQDIHMNYATDLDLKKIARGANISSEYLIRLFIEYEGITPIRYLWKIRLKRVLELLLHSGLSLNEIAEKTGFKNTHHLSRMVTKNTGLSPSVIRKRQS